MSEKLPGSAGPALAAHSKDAAGGNGGTAENLQHRAAAAMGGVTEKVNEWSGQAREAAGRMASSVSETATSATQQVAEQGGRTAEQVASFVREQPIAALVVTGAVCFALGLLLGRR